MKTLCGVPAAALLAAFVTGCSTIDPTTLPQTARDQKVFTETIESPAMPACKVALRSVVKPHESAKVKKTGEKSDEMKMDERLMKVAEDAISQMLAGLGKFDVVDRRNAVALSVEDAFKGAEAQPPAGADVLLVAESAVTYIAKQGWKRTSFADKARGAQVSTNFRLIDVATKEVVMSKTIVSQSVSNEKKNISADVERASKMNALKFSRVIAARYLPPVKVRQTRGDGQYALVGMGQNFQAVPAQKSWKAWPYKYLPLCPIYSTDVEATKIDFFENEKLTEGGKEKIVPNVVGHGEVIRCDKNTAWVEISDYKKVNVFKGHNAKVSEEIDGNPLDD